MRLRKAKRRRGSNGREKKVCDPEREGKMG